MSEFDPVVLSLQNGLTPSLALELLPHGFTIHRVFVQDGRTNDIVVSPERPEDHLIQKYTNTIIGRYANRLPIGTHSVERHGVKSNVSPVLNEGTSVSLHGGLIGFDYAPWHQISPTTTTVPPTLFTAAEIERLTSNTNAASHAIFRHESADGNEGFPGHLTVEALVTLIEPHTDEVDVHGERDLGSVLLVYRAKVAEKAGKKVVTPINLTQHWGFNLTASIKPEGSAAPQVPKIQEHTLLVRGDHYAELDSVNHLPTYVKLPVAGTHHEHKGDKTLAQEWDNSGPGYDDYYYLSHPPSQPTRLPATAFTPTTDLLAPLLSSTPTGRTPPAIELRAHESGLGVEFSTNQGGAMFYSNIHAMKEVTRKHIHGGRAPEGDGYEPNSAAFLEFHDPVAAFLNPETPDATLITSDEVYNNFVVMKVKRKE